MGHALDETLQDILIRWKRMQGYCTLWLPGTDHASIATEAKLLKPWPKKVLPKRISEEKSFRESLEWKRHYGGRIVEQLKSLDAPVTGRGKDSPWMKDFPGL